MLFYIEVTDTFGGEPNYSWVTRHIIRGANMRGAINRFSRMSGLKWRKTGDFGYQRRYDSASGATCFFIEQWTADSIDRYSFATDER